MLASQRALPACVVDGVLPGKYNLGDGDKGVAFLEQRLQNGGLSLWGVDGGIVEENDGARLHLAGAPLGDLTGGDLLSVQAIHVPNVFKLLEYISKRNLGRLHLSLPRSILAVYVTASSAIPKNYHYILRIHPGHEPHPSFRLTSKKLLLQKEWP